MSGKRNPWKEYHLSSSDDYRHLSSCWQSSRDAFGKGKRVVFESMGGGGYEVMTNLSLRDMAALARSACVRLPKDYLTGYEPGTTPPWEKGDNG